MIVSIKMDEIKVLFICWIVACIKCLDVHFDDENLQSDSSYKVKRFYLDCAEDTMVEPAQVLQLKTGYWSNSDKFKAWVHCVLVKCNLMTNQSVFQLDVALNRIQESERANVTKEIDDCLPKVASDPSDIAWKFAKCYHFKNKNLSVFSAI